MTHPEFQQFVLDDQERNLNRELRRAYLRRPSDGAAALVDEAVVLRLCSVHDDAALDRLAELEGQQAPTGRFVVAEVCGTVVAAFPIGCGSVLSDPFRATAHLIPLLELRAKQLGSECSPRRRFAAFSAVRAWGRA